MSFLRSKRIWSLRLVLCGGVCCLMWFGWGWGMVFIIPLCMIFGAVAIYYFLVSSRGNCNSHYAPRSDNVGSEGRARVILEERYAKGEINKEEFLQIKKELER